MAQAGHKANSSGQPILNISILVSRPLKPAILREELHYADQVYESIIKQIMFEHRLTRKELMNYKSELAGKVWYFEFDAIGDSFKVQDKAQYLLDGLTIKHT